MAAASGAGKFTFSSPDSSPAPDTIAPGPGPVAQQAAKHEQPSP